MAKKARYNTGKKSKLGFPKSRKTNKKNSPSRASVITKKKPAKKKSGSTSSKAARGRHTSFY